MRIEDALPALRAGRRARRAVWPAGSFITINEISGKRSDHFTMNSGASSHTWPSSQLESHDMLMDDWELLALPEYQAYVPYNFKEALDIVLSMMSHEDFDPYGEARNRRLRGNSMVDEALAECDWREMGKACLEHYIEAASAKDKGAKQAALAKACMASLKALSYHVAERYVEEVMRG